MAMTLLTLDEARSSVGQSGWRLVQAVAGLPERTVLALLEGRHCRANLTARQARAVRAHRRAMTTCREAGATCGSCGAPVIWAATVHGRAMPVDAEPSGMGNVALGRGSDGKLVATVLAGDALLSRRFAGEPLYLTHFATCPDAADHRRRKHRASA